MFLQIWTKKFDSFESLDEDIVAKVENGFFTFLGMPTKWMPESKAALYEKEDKI